MTRWTSLLLACALALPLTACGRQASYRAQGAAAADDPTPDADADPREDTPPDEDTPPPPDTDEPDTDEPEPDTDEPEPDTDEPDTDAPSSPTPSPEACALETLPLEEWPPNTQALWSRHLRGDVYPQASIVHISEDGTTTLTATDPRGLRLDDEAWEAGSAEGLGVLVVLSPDGATERALMVARVNGDPAQRANLERVAVAQDGRALVAISWNGDLLGPDSWNGDLPGPDDTRFPNPSLDQYNVFLALEPDGSLRTALVVVLSSNTVCQTAHPADDGDWFVSCYGGAGEGLAMRLDPDLNPRWELRTQAQIPAPGATYAYLFQNTAPSAGRSFLDVWRNTDALVGQTLVPFDSTDTSGVLTAAVRADSGQVEWVKPPPTGARLSLTHPAWSGFLGQAYDAQAQHLDLIAFDPQGVERWRCPYPIGELGALSLRSTLSDGLLVLEGLEDTQGPQTLAAFVDPRQSYALAGAVRFPLLHESVQLREDAGVLVVSLLLPPGRTTLFGRTFDAAGPNDRAILALPWPPR